MEGSSQMLGVSAVAAATGYSVQQIRDLERLGVITCAVRADNGYRQFSSTQIRDLRAYRDLAHAVGPVEARRSMRAIRTLPPEEAVKRVSALHAALNDERAQALVAREALQAIQGEAETDVASTDADAMTITELSRALGVRASTLRFWEKEGLVRPDRITNRTGSTRRYQLEAIREARITAALRAAGYRIPDVRRAVAAIRDLDDVSHSLEALDARLKSITDRTLSLFRAASTLAEIIQPDR
ncbi:MerR family transcriptional regulator [Mycolicibacterium fortuitum]|uniref:MerR family transcriptional regulator n=1 Tax=Mycolicibacterium fortuitum TaxID=1766 RepID=UPI00149082A6|nr:MerR family transcriptional regulator [Mycolicibacterium fortuitum]MBP3082625.1 MerR family transcriptional regulator [Mycolicibacterium fortuitum]NOQ59421.1 MerR family transcriptional regulator [Mycolicibacterium fortuitum]